MNATHLTRRQSLLLGATTLGTALSAPAYARTGSKPNAGTPHPDWAKDATIYQINTRQFSTEGTFRAIIPQLDRIKALGASILWLMPIHEIGKVNRKGSLGSPYSIRDYYSVNSEFGTLADFKALVQAAHDRGLKLIIDWVANHTAWDNPLVTQHPEWYSRDHEGKMHPTLWLDWTDIVDLDYSQPGLRQYMADAMTYWVRDVGIDGFRCDVAHFVPIDFWEQVRRQLDTVKPVFMLAEADVRDVHYKAFSASYGWNWNNAMHNIALGKADCGALWGYYADHRNIFPATAMRMLHVSNHDQNAWEGTAYERFGPATEAAVGLSVLGEGLPMIYNGQECGDPKRLAFFEKDPIVWKPHPMGDLYAKMFAIKKANPALWNAPWGGLIAPVRHDQPKALFAFTRSVPSNRILGLFNLSPQPLTATFNDAGISGTWQDLLSGERLSVKPGQTMTLPAWSWRGLKAV